MITRDKFFEATGREPTEDDLRSCNCPEVGTVGHLECGWNEERNLPQSMVGRVKWNGKWPLRGH